MKKEAFYMNKIPALLWGEKSDKLYLFVHGKMSCKEEAEGLVEQAVLQGYQVLSFDLPEHGERKGEKDYPCDIWNGMQDLKTVMEYAERRWKKMSLFACSIGVYFSLMAYQDRTFEQCLFLSPILDMQKLIERMMVWFQVEEETLKIEKRIETPMGEVLDWDYYSFVKAHPIKRWTSPTCILYGTKDNLTELETVREFAEKYKAKVEILEDGEHWFHTEEQMECFDRWLNHYVK